MKVCQYPGCHRHARFFMGWENKNEKHFELVCATCNRGLGRKNLLNSGMTMSEILLFEKYLRQVPEEVFYPNKHPDFPEWLEEYYKKHPIKVARKKVQKTSNKEAT